MNKETLQKEFLNQVNTVLPNLARTKPGYPVFFNHEWSRLLCVEPPNRQSRGIPI